MVFVLLSELALEHPRSRGDENELGERNKMAHLLSGEIQCTSHEKDLLKTLNT